MYICVCMYVCIYMYIHTQGTRFLSATLAALPTNGKLNGTNNLSVALKWVSKNG